MANGAGSGTLAYVGTALVRLNLLTTAERVLTEAASACHDPAMLSFIRANLAVVSLWQGDFVKARAAALVS